MVKQKLDTGLDLGLLAEYSFFDVFSDARARFVIIRDTV